MKINLLHTQGNKDLNIFSGKFNISEDYKDFFYKLYTKWVFKYEEEEHLTEKHHDEYSPVLIDLDFGYQKLMIIF